MTKAKLYAKHGVQIVKFGGMYRVKTGGVTHDSFATKARATACADRIVTTKKNVEAGDAGN